MYVDHLSLADYRSYPSVEVPLTSGVTTFVGANGQGKTNLVEAVEYLSTMSSHRVSSEIPLVRAGCERAIVRAGVRAGLEDDRRILLEIEITPGKANRARLNRSPLPRAREIVGMLRTVVFSPEDLAIVKGDPAERRHFLDALVVNRWPRMAGVKADYDKVLKQRNSLLKSLAGKGRVRADDPYAASTLEVWDSHLVQVGAELLEARLDTLRDLLPHTARAYAEIAPTNNVAAAAYRSAMEIGDSWDRPGLAEALQAQLVARRGDELVRGVTLAGPHRDDLTLTLGELPAKGYASHGESWSFALALKIGAFELLRADGIEPVLVLDDVFAELDSTRRERLAAGVVQAEQLLVTAAVGADVPSMLAGQRFQVGGGEVRVDD
ncbi:DNA replication/repair protein RecF [Naumannella sp. ID2617S]|uniref:DNA replication and repair protein RecF n=1 Tax=Enemella dayhoffiae TaxID=2016507 RepID=A0A255HC25_9ACTN|nr:DNA replication/repair protein RecF [Enemella dayhoffiae]NNG20128.1 DNA replication/repair protein RecF [Naumannella sp. ID2617S]OYO25329.1 DNA replication/repair protein RecF [Enemella dayhoffiae]